jgi:hypothetical protein
MIKNYTKTASMLLGFLLLATMAWAQDRVVPLTFLF